MRKECKVSKQVNIARIQGYHQRTVRDFSYENYAYQGYTKTLYLNSDRAEKTEVVNGVLVRANGQPLQGIGLEVELESSITRTDVLAEVMEKVIFPVFKFGADMFKMQSDCSLGGRTSVEAITQPMTISRIRNDYPAWQAMFDKYFPTFGIKADSYETSCGMHVNVSNALFGKTEEKQIDAIRKLYYIVNRHYNVMCKAFYRCPEKTRWCGRMDYSNARNLDLYHADGSHGNCMNLSHFGAGRVEIRLVGGQRDYYGFRNTMETIFHLISRVRTISWADCDDLVKIFSGCNQYVMKRLPDCGLDADTLRAIEATVKHEDFDLRRA